MATVLAQMGGDTGGACLLGQFGSADGVRVGATAGVADSGDMVDVDAKTEHGIGHGAQPVVALIIAVLNKSLRKNIFISFVNALNYLYVDCFIYESIHI